MDYRLDVLDVERFGEHRVARRTSVNRETSSIEPWPCRSKDTAANAAAALEVDVRGLDNRVYGQRGNVRLCQTNTAGTSRF